MYDEVRDPLSDSSAQSENLTLREEEEVSEGQPDSKLKKRFADQLLTSSGFCEKEYPALQGPFFYSLQLPTCVTKLFLLTSVKSQDRNGLTTVGNKILGTYHKLDQELSICSVNTNNNNNTCITLQS